MVFNIVGIKEHFPQFSPHPRRLHAVNAIRGLHRRGKMDAATDTANGGNGAGNLFNGQTDQEFFKAAKLDDLKKRLFDIAAVVEEDGYLAVSLKPGHGINFYFFHAIFSLKSYG